MNLTPDQLRLRYAEGGRRRPIRLLAELFKAEQTFVSYRNGRRYGYGIAALRKDAKLLARRYPRHRAFVLFHFLGLQVALAEEKRDNLLIANLLMRKLSLRSCRGETRMLDYIRLYEAFSRAHKEERAEETKRHAIRFSNGRFEDLLGALSGRFDGKVRTR